MNKDNFYPSPQLESVIYYGGYSLLKNKQSATPALAKKIRHDQEPWSGKELTYEKLKALSDMLNVNFSKEMGNPKPTYDTDTESTAQRG